MPEQELVLKAALERSGLILMTGPTGSGKTISLYAALEYLKARNLNILTVEDPVEIKLDGVTQVNINPKINLSFARVLKAFLRQDPDVIMIGEIRDLETAKIACEAAQTGHLVLSSLHSRSSIESINRLRHLGLTNVELASSLSLVIAQRLLRSLNAKGEYQGRTGVYEFLSLEPLTDLIYANAKLPELLARAKEYGFRDLRTNALNLVAQAGTSLEEVSTHC